MRASINPIISDEPQAPIPTMKIKTYATAIAALLFVFAAEHGAAAVRQEPGTRVPQMRCDAAAESCCKAWVHELLQQIGTSPAATDALAVVPRRVAQWLRQEQRSYCAIRKDLEARYFSQ
ncbi:MAG TPA: hypothetical protein VFV17_00995 [Usitatibacteraceae bacterium]|nr:hypothetical protein [Usitatibacteraceae bacterium]